MHVPLNFLMLATLSLAAGCSPPKSGNHTPEQDSGVALSPPSTRSPPPAPGPNYERSSTIAMAGVPDTKGLEMAQMDAMFEAAMAQARPGAEKRAVCVGMQGLSDRAVTDAPKNMIRRLAEALRSPVLPASQCSADVYPFVTTTKAEAILYTVKIESRDREGILTFWATAAFGNLGAHGAQFRLIRENGRWIPKPTGLSIVS